MLSALISLIIPPRPSERVVRATSLGQLRSLDTEEGLPYHDPRVTALVWELKYYANRRAATLAGEVLAERLLAVASEELGAPLVIPVPMHAARRRERGHNQTEVLCKAALPHLGKAVEYAPKALVRERATPTQQGLPRHVRLKNIKGSMRADARLVGGRACIVVDDVSTTGATLAEAKRALRLCGARAVHTITLARS